MNITLKMERSEWYKSIFLQRRHAFALLTRYERKLPFMNTVINLSQQIIFRFIPVGQQWNSDIQDPKALRDERGIFSATA